MSNKLITYATILSIITLTSCKHHTLTENEKKGLYGIIDSYKEIYLNKKQTVSGEMYMDTLYVKEYHFNDFNKIAHKTNRFKFLNKWSKRWTTYVYDNNQRLNKELTKSINDNRQDTLFEQALYFYNQKGLLTRTIDTSFTNHTETKYYYNDRQNLIKVVHTIMQFSKTYPQDTITTKEIELYDKKGLLQKKLSILPDKKNKIYDTVIIKLTYNIHNLPLKITFTNKDPDLNGTLHFEYEYDKKGSWIVKKELLDNELYGKAIRRIKYK